MNNIDNQLPSDRVSSSIQQESFFETDEEAIVDTCSIELAEACKVIYEWVVRTPHVYPFMNESIKRKDIRGFLKYQQALMDCVSGVGLIIFLDRDFNDGVSLVMSPLIKSVVDVTKDWLLAMELSDEKMFEFLIQSERNVYKTTSQPDRAKFEAQLDVLSMRLRKFLMDTGFREKVHSFKRNSTECFKQVISVCAQAFERHSHILISRLDWGYRRKVPDVRGVFKNSQDYVQRFKQVSDYRKKMLIELRNMYKKDLIFFVWKIECTSVRGLHIHWFIGINGAKHQDRINVPRAIAEKWDEVLGLGDSAYTRNINAHQKHESAILRVVEYNDPLLWRIVGGYADYLTKIDYLVRHRTPKGMRSFGSTKRSDVVKKKMGPMRTKNMPELDLWAVRRPFNGPLSDMTGRK